MNVKLIGKHEKDSRACRDAVALPLKEMMAEDKSICYVDCDLMGCINTKQLVAAYPERSFEAGIAEANAAGVAAGLAATGKKVFLHTFGTFASRRIYDQIYMSAAYADLTVHVLGSDAGVSAAFNGGTHMPLEDAAMYLSIPEATVFDPCDYDQLESIMRQLPAVKKGVPSCIVLNTCKGKGATFAEPKHDHSSQPNEEQWQEAIAAAEKALEEIKNA